MVVEKTINRLPIKSKSVKLLFGVLISALIAFTATYFGFFFIAPMFDINIKSNDITNISFIASGFMAIVAAMYIARELKMSQEFDERFLLHHLKINSLSEGITTFGMVVWFGFEKVVNNNILWPILIIWGIMAWVRFIALKYYQKIN